jgi:hypothetical protein
MWVGLRMWEDSVDLTPLIVNLSTGPLGADSSPGGVKEEKKKKKKCGVAKNTYIEQ